MTDIPRTEATGEAFAATAPLRTRPGASAATVSTPPSAASASAASASERRARPAPRPPRRARLVVKRVDPWSVLKFGAVFSLAILVVWVVTIGVLYSSLTKMGVWDHINSVLAQFTSKDGSTGYQITATTSQVVGWAAVIGAVNAVLFTALTTLGAVAYNLCSALAGGIEVTLSERE